MKRQMIRIFSFIFLILIFSSFTLADSISISPTKFEYFFKPGLEKKISFEVDGVEDDKKLEAYVRGDLSEYVVLSKENFVGKGKFDAQIKLPNIIERPGTHQIFIGVVESKNESDLEAGNVGGVAAVQALIEVIVPYPGKYIEGSFEVKDVNEGEEIFFDLNIDNLGKEDVFLNTKIEIYENNGDFIFSKNLEEELIESKETFNLREGLEGLELVPGSYNAFANINYGSSSSLNLNDSFRVGDFLINISNYSYVFIKGKINPFLVEVENLWNSKMQGVYAEVSITDQGEVVDFFKTPSINLEAWEKINLTGFFDATNLEEKRYLANIKVFYEEDSNFKLVAIYVVKEAINLIWYYLGIGFIVFLALVIGVFVYLIKRIKKLKENEKEEKKK